MFDFHFQYTKITIRVVFNGYLFEYAGPLLIKADTFRALVGFSSLVGKPISVREKCLQLVLVLDLYI